MAQNDKNSQTDLDGLEKMGMPDGQPRPIACLPIIGQIEGHMALSDSSKTTKYEHILPNFFAFLFYLELKSPCRS